MMFQLEWFEITSYGLRGACRDEVNKISWNGTLGWPQLHRIYGYTKEDLKVSPQKCWDIIEDFANNPQECPDIN